MATRDWIKGDSVVHAARPEWGPGEVLVAEPVLHEGRACQKLTIRFTRAGTKTISTGFAQLREATDQPRMPDEPAQAEPPQPQMGRTPAAPAVVASPDPIMQMERDATIAQMLTSIPEPATDPFSSLRSRLTATLDLYRYVGSGGSLLDWAAVQTGLKDPLSRFSRHELEQWFGRFQMELDNHLKRLLRDVRRSEPALLAELSAQASQAARTAIRRNDPR